MQVAKEQKSGTLLAMKPGRTEMLLLVAVFLDLLGFGMVLIDFQFRAERLTPGGWPAGVLIGGLLASTFITQMIVSPMWGHLSDRIGRKPVLVVCTSISAVAMLVYGASGNWVMLLGSRVLAGLGAANVATAQAMIADTHSGPSRTAALGRIGFALSLGLIIGPSVGGVLAAYGLAGFVAGGCSLLAAAVLAFGLPHAPPGEPADTGHRALLNASLLRDVPRLTPYFLIASVSWFSLAMLEGTFGRLIKALLGYGQLEFGLIFGYESLLALLIQGVLLVRLVKWFRSETLLRGAYVLQGAGLAATPLVVHASVLPPLVYLFAVGTLFAVGNSVSNPVVNSMCSEVTPDRRQGEMFGLLQGARSLGFVFGPLVGGALFEWRHAAPYFLAGGVCLIAAILVPRGKPSAKG